MESIPHFTLRDENGEPLDSMFLEGMAYVLCFVPDLGDGSCDVLNGFDDIYPKLMIRNTPTLAVVPEEPSEISAVRDRLGLKIKLLSDADGRFAEECGVSGIAGIVVGRDGGIVSRHTGAGLADAVYNSVKSLLK